MRKGIWIKVLLVLVAAVALLPVLALFGKATEAFDLPFWQHLTGTILPYYILNTILLMIGTGFLSLFFGLPCAWCVAHYNFPGKQLFQWLLLLPLAFSSYIMGMIYKDLLSFSGPFQTLFRGIFGWTSPSEYWFPECSSLPGLVFVLSLVLYPYVFFLARTVFEHQANAYLEIGKSCGLGGWRLALRVILPIARPAIGAGLLLVSMETLSDFGAASLFGVHTISVGLYTLWFGFHKAIAASQLSIAVIVFVFFTMKAKDLMRREPTGTIPIVRSTVFFPRRLRGFAALPPFAICSVPVILGFIAPIAALFVWIVQYFDQIPLEEFRSDLYYSLVVALSVAFICILASMIVSVAQRRFKESRLVPIAVRALYSMYALPNMILAIGVLILIGALYSQTWVQWLANSVAIVIIAHSLRFFALAFFPIRSQFQRIPERLDEAAAGFGIRGWRMFFKVHLPLVIRGAWVGGLLAFVDSLKELTMVLVLQPYNFQTLSLRVFSYANNELVEQSALWAFCIVLVGALPILILNDRLRIEAPTKGD